MQEQRPMMYALLVYADPAHTHARSERELAGTSEHPTAYYEVACHMPERAQEIAAHILDDHVIAVEVRRIHDTA